MNIIQIFNRWKLGLSVVGVIPCGHRMPYSSEAIANEFIALAKNEGKSITPMKVQKLTYFAHGWYLALSGQPLLNETVEAWNYGPVIRSLYHKLKKYGNDRISTEIEDEWSDDGSTYRLPDTEDSARVRRLINRVWDVYKPFDAIALSDMTHQADSPWSETVAEYGGQPPKGLDIPNDRIRDYFKQRLGKSQ